MWVFKNMEIWVFVLITILIFFLGFYFGNNPPSQWQISTRQQVVYTIDSSFYVMNRDIKYTLDSAFAVQAGILINQMIKDKIELISRQDSIIKHIKPQKNDPYHH